MAAAMRGMADEVECPKYAHIERERRWLVDARARPPLETSTFVAIEDRYIRGTRLRLRRMTDTSSGTQSLKLTRKYESPDPLARPIVTAYLTQAEHALFATLDADPLSKRRYPLVQDGVEWSLDCFSGPLEGLELLEAEAPSAADLTALRPPSWVTAEVSNDPRFAGATLAAAGLPEEK